MDATDQQRQYMTGEVTREVIKKLEGEVVFPLPEWESTPPSLDFLVTSGFIDETYREWLALTAKLQAIGINAAALHNGVETCERVRDAVRDAVEERIGA